METIYCEKCGILHDLDDGDCEGCKLIKRVKQLEDENKKLRDEKSLSHKTLEIIAENQDLKNLVLQATMNKMEQMNKIAKLKKYIKDNDICLCYSPEDYVCEKCELEEE